ncbi:hypothetical protein KBY91_15355 [Streptomyces sp. RK23]|nr:hypothetical protein [Streptomyces sp. RK74B]MBQ1004786.1 hypothetical protein [Streptomyces sp. RK23]
MIGMQPEVLSGLIGFGGALVGGAASFGGVWLTLSHQRKQARETRLLEIGQAAADKALAELIALEEFLGSLRDNEVVAETDERLPYLSTAAGHLKNVELAITRIPDREVRDRVNGALYLTRRYRAAGPRHYFVVRWIRELTQDMIEILSAYIRHDALPPRSEDVLRKQDIMARYEERQRRHLEHLHDPANVDPREEDDTSSPSAN